MTGISLALLASILLVIGDAGKKDLSGQFNTPLIVWNNLLLAILLILSFLTVNGVYITQFHIFWSLLCGIAMFGSEIFFMRALRSGDFSLSQPFKAFLPLITIPIAWVLLGEVPTMMACFGAVLTTFGAWLLFLPNEKGISFKTPFILLVRSEAARSMVISGLFGAIAANLQRYVSQSLEPLSFFVQVLTVEFLIFTAYLLLQRRQPLIVYRIAPKRIIGTGVLWGLGMTLSYMAVTRTTVLNVYVISQIQPLLALFIAHFFFREKASARIVPTLCMIVGVLVVLFSQSR